MLITTTESETRPARRSAEQPSVEAVDLKHLRRYTMGDLALEKEVLQLFLLQLPVTIKSLSSAATDRDWLMAAHTLKGSCRAVGAWRVAGLAEQAERQIAAQTPALRADAVAGIEEAADEARNFIDQTYPDAG